MASVNKVILLGHLGADPEFRQLASGQPVASLRVATTETWREKSTDRTTGEKKEHTEWHRVVLFGRTAQVAADYLRKGSPVYLEGRLRTRKWTGQDGRERAGTEIVADTLRLLGRRGEHPAERPPYRPHAGVDDLDVPYEITDPVGVWGGEEPPF